MPPFSLLTEYNKKVLGFLRGDKSKEEKGSIKSRVFDFLDKIQGATEKVNDFAISSARGSARVPETMARSFLQAGTSDTASQFDKAQAELADRLKTVPGSEASTLRQDVQKNMSRGNPLDNFDSGTPTDPIRRLAYGSEPIQTYQTRREGYKKALEQGTYTGAGIIGGKDTAKKLAEPLSFLGMAANIGLDIPGGLGKNAGKSLVSKVTTGGRVALEADKPIVNATTDIAKTVAEAPAPKILPQDGIESVIPKLGERQRGLLKTVEQADTLPLEARQAVRTIEPQTYKQINLEETLNKARQQVNTNFDEAKKIVDQGLDSKIWDDQTSSLTRALVEKAAREGNDTLVKELMDRAASLGTSSGQANVLWRGMASAYDPEGMVRFAQKVVDDANKNAGILTKIFRKGEYTLDDVTKESIRSDMTKVLKLADGPEKDQVMKGIFEKINDRIPPGASEMFDAYRYQNLLSNPRTHGRNIGANLFNAMITRPVTLASRASVDWFASTLFGKQREYYLKEVPQYFRGMFNSFGDAIEASKQAWKGELPIGQPDLRNLQTLRRTKLPKGLTVVPRFMEAQDRFLMTMISAGEYAAQKSKGVADAVARAEAEKVANYSLFRSLTDPKNATGQGALLSKIDQFTELVSKIGQKHQAFRWFVPFVRTPANISKQFIEYSPLGFATLKGSNRKVEQFSKALTGSMLTAIGAKLALDGNTTWAPPKDETERKLFYESGKRPYSVKIGDKWVPMVYFGPFSLAFALPAAAKDANDNAPLDASTLERLGAAVQNSAKFFSQQTYVQGIANVVSLISGEADTNIANTLGFTAGQALPFQGLQRYVAGIFDPTFRKAQGFTEAIQRDTPILSRNLDPYTTLSGEESKRNTSDYLAPYTLGSPTGSDQEKAMKKANAEFLKTLRQTSRMRTRANDQISEAVAARDYERAQKIAESYNNRLKEVFAPIVKKNRPYLSNYLTEQYSQQKIQLTQSSLARRRYNALVRNRNERSLVGQ